MTIGPSSSATLPNFLEAIGGKNLHDRLNASVSMIMKITILDPISDSFFPADSPIRFDSLLGDAPAAHIQ